MVLLSSWTRKGQYTQPTEPSDVPPISRWPIANAIGIGFPSSVGKRYGSGRSSSKVDGSSGFAFTPDIRFLAGVGQGERTGLNNKCGARIASSHIRIRIRISFHPLCRPAQEDCVTFFVLVLSALLKASEALLSGSSLRCLPSIHPSIQQQPPLRRVIQRFV